MPSRKQNETKSAQARQSDHSLVEALQNLVNDMTRAATEADAQEGLKRLKELRIAFLGGAEGDLKSARRDAEALIAWVEQRLEQLREQLARKRRAQEGEAMEQIAREREAAGPSLLPTELIDAVVHATESKDPEAPTSSAPQAEPVREQEAPREKRKAAEKAAEKKAEKKTEKKAEPAQAGKEPEWKRFELLAAHLAASVREDKDYFEKLRRSVKAKGPRQKAPADDQKAEAHFRTVHDLGKRLVNLELHTKSLAAAEDGAERLLKTAARELKGFFKDFKAAKEKLPEMAGEYERLFGGWAEKLSAIKPEKGGDILEKLRAGKQPQAEARQEAAADAPQLVLRRNEWEQ